MVTLGIDEVTFIVLPGERIKERIREVDWSTIAEHIIRLIENAICLIQIMGEAYQADTSNVQGYSVGYEYGRHPFYFRVCYHEAVHSMGVVIRFSASALRFYLINSLEPIHSVPDMLRQLREALPDYKVLFSRIDFAVDYINEGISVNDIQEQITTGNVGIFYENGRKNGSSIRYINQNGITDTIYIGTREKNTKTMLRIYNKKKEQLQTHGTQYELAAKSTDWVRVENEIHGDYAHSLSDELYKFTSEEELLSFIALCINNKYSFRYTETEDEQVHYHAITKSLRDAIKRPSSYYYTISGYKDLSLKQNLDYLINKSGLMAFLYKIEEIEEGSIDRFFTLLKNRLEYYNPNTDTIKWMRTHYNDYIDSGITDLFK
ncbi:MAG: replication initiation factor domain-containing protein [Firmicutes bacterium]|nr:replication initiation factor domain-containing protein [Bacillota bacterium]